MIPVLPSIMYVTTEPLEILPLPGEIAIIERYTALRSVTVLSDGNDVDPFGEYVEVQSHIFSPGEWSTWIELELRT